MEDLSNQELKVLSQEKSSAHANRLLRRRFFAGVMKRRKAGGFGPMLGSHLLPYSLSRDWP